MKYHSNINVQYKWAIKGVENNTKNDSIHLDVGNDTKRSSARSFPVVVRYSAPMKCQTQRYKLFSHFHIVTLLKFSDKHKKYLIKRCSKQYHPTLYCDNQICTVLIVAILGAECTFD